MHIFYILHAGGAPFGGDEHVLLEFSNDGPHMGSLSCQNATHGCGHISFKVHCLNVLIHCPQNTYIYIGIDWNLIPLVRENISKSDPYLWKYFEKSPF